MSLLNELDELKHEMGLLKDYLIEFKGKLDEIAALNTSSIRDEDFEDVYQLVVACISAFEDGDDQFHNYFEEVPKPNISTEDPIQAMQEGLDHLKSVQKFLIGFKDDLKRMPHIPLSERKKYVYPDVDVPFDPGFLLEDESDASNDECVFKVVLPQIAHPDTQGATNMDMIGTDYIPFNNTIPDKYTDIGSNLLNKPSTSKDYPGIIVSDYDLDQLNKPNAPSLLDGVSSEPQIAHPDAQGATNMEMIGTDYINQLNIASADDKVSNVQKCEKNEIQNAPSLLDAVLSEEIQVDEIAKYILTELSKKNPHVRKVVTHTSDSTSTSADPIVTAVPPKLKLTKNKKLKNYPVLLPHYISGDELPKHYFDDKFDVCAEAAFKAVLTIRSYIKPAITQSENVSDIVHAQPLPDPHYQSQIQTDKEDYIPGPSSQLPQTGSVIERETTDKDKQDASYINFQNVLHEKNRNKLATPNRLEVPALTSVTDRTVVQSVREPGIEVPALTSVTDQTVVQSVREPGLPAVGGGRSVRAVSEADMAKILERHQYETMCLLREIGMSSNSNHVSIEAIKIRFRNNRVGFCKLLRTIIDLQCFDLIRIVKEGNVIRGIDILSE